MSQVTKILPRVVLTRIINKIRPQISEEQYKFVKGKGTRNAIFVLRNLAEKVLEVNQDLYLCFVDYEKAFDKVKHEGLMKMLERLEIDEKDLRIIKKLYWNQKVAVKIDDVESKRQCIEIGVRQGCVMSPHLFNLYSEMIIREIKSLEGIRLNRYNINNI